MDAILREMPRHGHRRTAGLLLILAAPLAACASIAGIGGFEVDPCFDGCEGGTTDGAIDGPLDAPTDKVTPDGTTPDGTTPDAASCACPDGTTSMNNACVATGKDPSPYSTCAAALKLPDDCNIKVVVTLCDSDPAIPFTGVCAGDAGIASRPSLFVQLGGSSTGKVRASFTGSYNVARPSGSCSSGDAPCAAGNPTGVTTFTINSLPAKDLIVFGKRTSGSPCDEITIDTGPAAP